MVAEHFVKILFPFQYNKNAVFNLDEVTISSNGKKPHKLFRRIGFDGTDLRKGLAELFSAEDNKSSIMRAYRVDKNVRERLGLPKKETELINFYGRGMEQTNPYLVKILDLSVYLFESGVGFVEIEIKHENQNISELISGNYFLSEIGDAKNHFIINKKVWKADCKEPEKTAYRFTLKELLKKLLVHIPEVKDFYTGKEWEKVFKKGIVYSYIYMDEKPENFQDLLFNLRQNYKESYKAPQKYDRLQDDRAVLQQFENSYWVSSYNGATNISIKTEDITTNSFFEKDFYGKMHNVYFVLFLAVLHQKYTILKLMADMGELDHFDADIEKMKIQLMKSRIYQREASCLRFRDFFKFPSYIQHVNDYYNLLYRTFSIEELYRNFSRDLTNIEEICKMSVERIKMQENCRKQFRKSVVTAVTTSLTSLLALTTLLNDSWTLVEKNYGIPSGSFSIPVIFVTIILAIPSILSVVEAVENVNELKKERKEMEETMIGMNLEKS